jgi:gas vesicle protein
MSKFITGVALGIIVGILIAPDKGAETRRKVSKKGKELKRQFNDFVDTWSDRIDSWKNEAEEEVVELTRSESFSSKPYSA